MFDVCIQQAHDAYDVPAAEIVRIMDEHPQGGVGPMGIPDAWLPILDRVGFPAERLKTDTCLNIAAAAWIMAYEHMVGGGTKSGAPSAPPLPAQGGGQVVSDACISSAAHKYNLPVTLLRGVLATEGGYVGQIHWNANGSYDMGPAQVNSIWLPKLASAGITKAQVINDGCLNVHVGAWILAQAMQGADPNNPAQFWRHVGDYNSATPEWNRRYAAMVWNKITEKQD